jgi:cobalamin synthase
VTLTEEIRFLTRLPGRFASPERLARGLSWFPVVGLLCGGISGLVALVWTTVVPIWAAALLTILTYFGVKGWLHWDGLADVADGLAVPGSSERRREALRDPRKGTAGVLVLALAALTFYGILSHWQAPWPMPEVPRPPPVLRWAYGPGPVWSILPVFAIAETCANNSMVFACFRVRPMPGSVLAPPFISGTTPRVLLTSGSITVALSVLLGGWMGGLALLSMIVGPGLSRWLGRPFGGTNGDVLGAVQVVMLLTAFFLANLLPWPPFP